MTPKIIFSIASISGMLAVGLGAFGAHALKSKLEAANLVSTFQTAVQYHFYHTLLLLVLGLVMYKIESPMLSYAAYVTVAGIFLFSGSLYTLCLTNVRWLGAITPIGGLCFILGWLFLLLAVVKSS